MASLTFAGIVYLFAIREFFATRTFPRRVVVLGILLAAVWHVEFLRLPVGVDDIAGLDNAAIGFGMGGADNAGKNSVALPTTITLVLSTLSLVAAKLLTSSALTACTLPTN